MTSLQDIGGVPLLTGYVRATVTRMEVNSEDQENVGDHHNAAEEDAGCPMW